MDSMIDGSCMCGGVRFRAAGPLRPVFNCHCHRCRPFSGHYVAATGVERERFELEADETLKWFEPAPGVFYGFCSECGSSLFFRTDATSERISIMAGTLDQPTGLKTTEAWWVSEVADYHQRQAGLVEHRFDG